MNRRDALKLAGLALALPAASVVQANEPFQIIEPAQKADDPSKIEVLEFFSYGCIHCFNFEPMVKAWLKQKPAHAADKLFALFFTEQVRPAGNKPQAVADWVAKAGVDRVRFLEAYQSFGVAGKVRRASQLADLYQVEGTPAVGIAGRFLVPGQAERTLPIVNALIAEARKG